MDPEHPLYHPCVSDSITTYRLVSIPHIMRQRPLPKLHKRELYFAHTPSKPLGGSQRNVLGSRTGSPLCIPGHMLLRLRDCGVTVDITPKDLHLPWDGEQVVGIQLRHYASADATANITFGRCRSATTPAKEVWPLFVTASRGDYGAPYEPTASHHCSTDHIDQWPDGRMQTAWLELWGKVEISLQLDQLGYELRSYSSRARFNTYILNGLKWKYAKRVLFTSATHDAGANDDLED